MPDRLPPVYLFDAELPYQDGLPPVVAADVRGDLVGSGTGRVAGPCLNGTLLWSNFEQVFDDHCRLIITGVIDTDDGAHIRFESQGFALPLTLGATWAVAAAVRFTTDDQRYVWVQSMPATWQGEFDEATATARYRAFRPGEATS